MWYDLKVGSFKIKYTPIKSPTQEFEECDEDGNKVTKEKGTYTKGKIFNSKGTEISRTYRKINGKVVDKFKKTKEVTAYKEVDEKEIGGFMCEAYYFVECEALKEELKNSKKALVFGFTNGNGFKYYKSYISVYGNALIMRLGLGHLNTQIEQIQSDLESKKQLDELKLPKVESANVEQLITI